MTSYITVRNAVDRTLSGGLRLVARTVVRERTSLEIQSVQKALRLLDLIAERREPQGVSELARLADLDKSSVSRLLRTLEGAQLVAQNESTRAYSLGLRLVHLGQRTLQRLDFRDISRAGLRRLAHATGECAHAAVLAGERALYISQETPGVGVVVDAPVGSLAPLHCTALGKVLVAGQSATKREALIEKMQFERHTRRTIGDPEQLRRSVERIRIDNIAYDDEEFSVGVRCVAAPVWGSEGVLVGAIGISGPSPRVTDERITLWEPLLRHEAETLSKDLGWEPDLGTQGLE